MTDLPPTRREILRQYIFALFAEGHFAGIKSPSAMAAKAVKVFSGDLPIVLGELATTSMTAMGNRLSAALIEKVTGVLKDVDRRGVKAVWEDVQDLYRRGSDANAGRGK